MGTCGLGGPATERALRCQYGLDRRETDFEIFVEILNFEFIEDS